MNDVDFAIPPLLLIGMEGFWGTLLCVTVVYPIAYWLPGNDHGSIENPFNSYAIFCSSPSIQFFFWLFFFSILLYNILAVLVTFMLDSVWHAILDNFRPVTVWSLDLFIFYFISTSFGETWNPYSYLQLLGMVILLYGTAIYNAPNAGSLKLTGDWKSLYLDCSEEYEDEVVRQSEPFVQQAMSPMLISSPSIQNKEKRKLEMKKEYQMSASLLKEATSNNSKKDPNNKKYGSLEA